MPVIATVMPSIIVAARQPRASRFLRSTVARRGRRVPKAPYEKRAMRQLYVSSSSRALGVSVRVFVWTGAALFVASLLWFVYCYLVRFGRPIFDPAAAFEAIAIDVLLFSAFALHHSVLARSGMKRYVHRIAPQELERSIYTWTASLLFLAACTLWVPVPGVLYRLEGAWRLIGYAVQLLGLLLSIATARRLDVLDLAGVRSVLRHGSDPTAEHVPLETAGVYGFVRHPLYLAWICFVFGAPDMTATRATFAVVSTLYLVVAIPLEERGLVDAFGADYEAYRRKVRWRMIPGVY
jgi:protein-S-isoprenylcysteine O-methyltransferase Ste14